MYIGIIGYTGFIGRTVFDYLKQYHNVSGINRSNYHQLTATFDVIVNCAGTSLKYLTNANTAQSILTEMAILRLIDNLKFNRLIHISTNDTLIKSS